MRMNRIKCSNRPYQPLPYFTADPEAPENGVKQAEEEQIAQEKQLRQEAMQSTGMKMKRINCKNLRYQPFDYFTYGQSSKNKQEIIMQEESEEVMEEAMEEEIGETAPSVPEYMQAGGIKTNRVKCSTVPQHSQPNYNDIQIPYDMPEPLVRDNDERPVEYEEWDPMEEKDAEELEPEGFDLKEGGEEEPESDELEPEEEKE